MDRRDVQETRARDPGEESEMRSGLLVPVVIGALGVAGSLFLAGSLWFAERSEARADFERESRKFLEAARREVELHVEQVRSLTDLFKSSKQVEPGEFATFTESRFTRYPALRVLLWVDAATAPAVSLSAGPESADYARDSAAPARAALARSLAQGTESELALSVPVARADGTRVLVLSPVVSGSGERGFVAGAYDVALLLERARRVVGALDLVVSAQDEHADAPLVPALTPADPEAQHVEELELGGRTWRLSCAPPAGFLAAQRTWRPWIGLVCGLLATALLVATFLVAAGRERMQQLVEGRTREVKQAYLTLSHEAKERLWAMGERRQLEEQLRTVIDLVPDRIFVKDALGRFLLANRATAEAYGTTVERLTAPRYVDRNGLPRVAGPPLDDEQRAMQERRAVVLSLPFTTPAGRRRLLRQSMIPCDAFGAQQGAMLCVATDITEQKQAEDVLRAQNKLLSELARGDDPERVLMHIVQGAEALVSDMRCSVLLLSPEGRHLRRGYAPSLPEEYNAAIDGLEIGPEVGSCGAAAALGQRFVVGDVLTHPNWAPYRELAQRSGIRACWSQPIRAADGAVLGTFALYYAEPRLPAPFEERFIEAMAHMAGIAIERARLGATS